MGQNDAQQTTTPQAEERGLVTDVVVPIAQSAVSGAVGAVVGAKLGKGKEPKSK